MRPTSLRCRPPREQIPIGADLTTADDTGRPKVARTDEICRTREAVLADRVGQDTAADISADVDAGPIIDGRRWKRLGISRRGPARADRPPAPATLASPRRRWPKSL